MDRTRDGRIIDKRVKIPKKLINEILLGYKSAHNLTWKEFADVVGVSRYTIRYDWRKNGNTIPESMLKNILKLHPSIRWVSIKDQIKILEPYWGQKKGKRSRVKKEIEIKHLEDSGDFAELYGILLGDGCIYSNLTGFCISGNSVLDKHYLESYVSDLIFRLFNLRPKIYYSKEAKSVRCVLYSKAIARLLVRRGFPKGYKKINKVKIPNRLFKKKSLIRACIRGINDTDGSIYHQKNSKIILDICIKTKSLLDSTIRAFMEINFPINYTHNRIYLCGQKSISKFIEEIGSSNLRNIKKYERFLKTGKVPTSLETETFLRKEKTSEIKLPYYGPVV